MNKIIIKIAKTDNDFVGIYTNNNEMNITFPIGYNIKEETIYTNEKKKILDLQPDVTALLMLIEKQPNDNEIDNFNLGNNFFSFSCAAFLIEDFFKNGLYHENRLIQTNKNNNNINWPSTITKKIPFCYLGDYIYTNTINNEVSPFQTSITDIQLICLNKAFLILGIFYNNYQLPIKITMSKQEMIYKIKKALATTNNDTQRKRLDMMKLFIEGTSFDTINEKEIKIGRTHFDKVWEHHLKKHITKLLPQLEIFPTAFYMINNQKISTAKQIPDIIVEDKNTIYLIDAKYYKIDSLPQNEDINKQLLYADYINNQTHKKIKNIFLLPNNIKQQEKFTFLGYASTDSYLHKNGGKINVYYLDTKTIFCSPNFIVPNLLKH